ncbi:MAG: ABC transporter ATP-binding protein [Campylobacterota bacterium]|nr:ABC transporter ATP-binding protein [Campylobacterota bacterium]
MINLIDTSKQYKINNNHTVKAINNINLSIKEGELVVLKGSSGSGKSTILSLIAGMTKPTSGEVVVDKKRISKLPDKFLSLYRRENIGFIFQKYNLLPNLTVQDNIILPLVPNNPNENDIKSKLEEVLAMFEISSKKDIVVKNLSGGEQQRVAISRALINGPKIIIADEPTANLDEKLSLEFINILKELKKTNKTIIVATHDPLFFKLDFVDRIVEVKSGNIVK